MIKSGLLKYDGSADERCGGLQDPRPRAEIKRGYGRSFSKGELLGRRRIAAMNKDVTTIYLFVSSPSTGKGKIANFRIFDHN